MDSPMNTHKNPGDPGCTVLRSYKSVALALGLNPYGLTKVEISLSRRGSETSEGRLSICSWCFRGQMTDIWSAKKRSEVMSRIRGKDTLPERALRSALWKTGVRYRIHDRTVPGTPDISHKGAKVAIFVDGCFWHGCPKHYIRPAQNREFWDRKLAENRSRREAVRGELHSVGWEVVELWECDLEMDVLESATRIRDEIERRR